MLEWIGVVFVVMWSLSLLLVPLRFGLRAYWTHDDTKEAKQLRRVIDPNYTGKNRLIRVELDPRYDRLDGNINFIRIFKGKIWGNPNLSAINLLCPT